MTDIKDVEQRAKDMIEKCRRAKAQRENAVLADKIFHEPKRQAEQKAKQEREETERQKQLEERWSPYLERAMQRMEQEQQKHDKIVNKLCHK